MSHTPARQIKESDWKVFRRLHKIALDRVCQRVIEEVRATSACSDSYHDCYLTLYALIRRSDQEIAITFNDPRRSMAIIQLANIVEQELLTDEEMMLFSSETRETIEAIVSGRRA